MATRSRVAIVCSGPRPLMWECAIAQRLTDAGFGVVALLCGPSPAKHDRWAKRVSALAPGDLSIRPFDTLNGGDIDVVIDLSGSRDIGEALALCDITRIVITNAHGNLTATADEAFAAYVGRRQTVDLRIVAIEKNTRAGALLFEVKTAVRRDHMKTIAGAMSGIPDWIHHALIRLAAGMTLGAAPYPTAAQAPAPSPIKFGIAFMRALASYAYEWFTIEQWNIGLARVSDPAEILDRWDWKKVKWFPSPRSLTFLADPFLARCNETGVTVFCEALDYRDGKGNLVEIRCDANLTPSHKRTLASFDVHSSYPFPFHDGDKLFVLPEMAESGHATLYRHHDEQLLAVHGVILSDIPLVDGSLFRHDGRLWLFGTRGDSDSTLSLHAWFADTLDGPWTPHPLNPLKCDVSASRPAGAPFTVGHRLIRPSQNCARTYGGAITLNEIQELSPTRFRETVAGQIEPDCRSRFADGTHTIGWRDGVAIIDAKRNVFTLFAPAIRRKMYRLSIMRKMQAERSGPHHEKS